MADQQLNIKLNAIDNASKALTDIKNSIFNVRNALIGLGAGVVVNSLVNIGKEADDVRGRLNQLSKAGYGGSQAFDQLTKFAIDAKIPLLDVFQASGDLLAISKSPEELAKNLQIASNASAYFKISFVEASDQVAKALLKGIDSARLFQDKGIKSLRGFGEFADKSFEGVGRSLERNFGANGVFGKTNQELKDGLSGTIIALDNRFKQFQITIAQGFFDSLTKELGDLEIFLKNNNKAVDDLAKNIGEALGKAVIALGKAVVFVKDNFDILVNLFFFRKFKRFLQILNFFFNLLYFFSSLIIWQNAFFI
jgi:phage tail tape-measure protein